MTRLLIIFSLSILLSLSARAESNAAKNAAEDSMSSIKNMVEQVQKMDDGKIAEILNQIKESGMGFKDLTVAEFRKAMDEMVKFKQQALEKGNE